MNITAFSDSLTIMALLFIIAVSLMYIAFWKDTSKKPSRSK